MKHPYHIALFGLMILAGCSGSSVKETLGLERQAPDEFRVVSRPPLSVPPQFSLRPPSTTDGSPVNMPADQQAKSLVTGVAPQPSGQDNVFILKPGNADTAVAPVTSNSNINMPAATAESQFLKKAGVDNADPNVRNELVEERYTKQQVEEESSWWDILSTNAPKKDPTVNPKKEAERIQKNDEEGKPVTEGETAEDKGGDTGVLGRILGY